MKILVIHNYYLEKGGEDRAVEAEVKMLREHGHEILFYHRSNKDIKNLGLFRRAEFLWKNMRWSRESYESLQNLVRSEKPDLAHIHNIFFLLSPSVYCALREAQIPTVQTLHNYRLICPKGTFHGKKGICEKCLRSGPAAAAVLRRCWRGSFILTAALAGLLRGKYKGRTLRESADAFIALSGFSRDKFAEAGFPGKKLFIKPNFVDCRFSPEKKEGYGLFVGRLADYKGIDTLLKAYERLAKHHLKVVGDGPMLKGLKKRLKKAKNVQLLGALSHKETLGYLAKASFVVFPSECYENMPLVIIESMAAGVPVVASDLGAMKELIEDNVSGILFKPRDAQDLAGKIEFLAGNRRLIEQLGANARRSYEARFTGEINYGILMDIYNKAIAANKNEKN